MRHDLARRPDLEGDTTQARASAAPGRALPDDTRAAMEHAFGADFGAVRVHEGDLAARYGARALAHGDDLHFAPGEYAPDTAAGRDVLGHELAHVVQQRRGRTSASFQGKGLALVADPHLESEADDVGHRAARGEVVASAPVATHVSSAVAQRLVDPNRDSGAPIDISQLDEQACIAYLRAFATKDPTIQFEPGDDQLLREQLARLRGGSILDEKLGQDRSRSVGVDILLNPGEQARTDEVRLGEVLVGGDPLDCGSTANLMSDVFLGDDAEEFRRHNSVPNRTAKKSLGLGNDTTNDQLPQTTTMELQIAQGTHDELGTLKQFLGEMLAPTFVQMSVMSNPPGLGHTFVIEVFGRVEKSDPILGRVHQSFVGTYPLHAWLSDPKNRTLDVPAYLDELQAMCASGSMPTYCDKFLIDHKREEAPLTARKSTEEFERTNKDKAYKIALAYTAKPFDRQGASGRLDQRVPGKDLDTLMETVGEVKSEWGIK